MESDFWVVLATGAVAILSGFVGGLVPALGKLIGDGRARRAARHEVVADLAGELLDLSERFRDSRSDVTRNEEYESELVEMGFAKRPDWLRQRDDVRAQMTSLAVRIGARHKTIGEAAAGLVKSADGKHESWSAARDTFTAALSGLAR